MVTIINTMCKIQYHATSFVTRSSTNWFILPAVLCHLNEPRTSPSFPFLAISLYFVTLFLLASFIFKAWPYLAAASNLHLAVSMYFGPPVSGKVVTYFAGMSQTLSKHATLLLELPRPARRQSPIKCDVYMTPCSIECLFENSPNSASPFHARGTPAIHWQYSSFRFTGLPNSIFSRDLICIWAQH